MRILISVLLISIFASTATVAQDLDSTVSESLLFENTALGFGQLIVPTNIQNDQETPLVIAMHGYGSDMEEFSDIGKWFAEAGMLAVVPQAQYPVLLQNGRLGYDWTLLPVQDTVVQRQVAELVVHDYLPSLVSQVQDSYTVGDVYILGFSQGAVIALLAGIFDADSYNGVMTFGLPAFERLWFPDGMLEAGPHTPFWMAHGTQDQRVEADISWRAADTLEHYGFPVIRESFEGGHFIPNEMLQKASEWITGIVTQ